MDRAPKYTSFANLCGIPIITCAIAKRVKRLRSISESSFVSADRALTKEAYKLVTFDSNSNSRFDSYPLRYLERGFKKASLTCAIHLSIIRDKRLLVVISNFFLTTNNQALTSINIVPRPNL